MVREILLVDDEPSLCKALKSFFEERGFRVETATTGQAALERLQQTPAEIVLLDLKLPDRSGLDVLSYLKEHAPASRVVVISGTTDQETIREVIDMGADQYLTKPFDFSRCFNAAMGIETLDLAATRSEPEAIARVPRSIAEQYRVLPLKFHDGILEVAAADALDQKSLEQLGLLVQCQVRAYAAVGADLAQAIRRGYGDTSTQEAPARPPSSAAPHPLSPNVSAAQSNADGSSDTVHHLVDQLLRRAAARQATDLHLGVGPKGPWFRVRIDGVLHELPVPPDLAKRYASLVAHLKRITNLDVAESHLPQEGRSRWMLGSAPFTLQISMLPTPYGESVAIRLLAPSRLLRLDQLGFSEEQRAQLERVLNRPSGLVLVTGPDGSGKSSTLYALLAALNTGHFNIVTVEGSVECDLPGVTQVAVQANAGLTFARGLRSVLAHDPDIIMVGEIRDQETAGLAVWAALTGHVVLAALHTTDAANAITRLFDFGIEPFLLCSTVSAILSQRLIRLLCPQCRESVQLDTTNLAPLGVVVPSAQQQQPLRIWRARRCRACQATGYQGRTGIFELLMIDHHLRSLIIKRASAAQIRQSAMSKGMTSLWQAGWQHLKAGRTSFEELSRVLTSISTP